MALVIYWYDFICFAIVATSIFISIWIIWQKEGNARFTEKTIYYSLLISEAGHGDDGPVGVTWSEGTIRSTQLWTSCWRGVHPIWLMVYRLASAIVMAGILAWDIRQYDTTIFMYYTEYAFDPIFNFTLNLISS
ncbi:rolling protein [Thalictrum thalictroides]|uniref:Rolling protein n=1 Tax=Thalictrum thalictroides TaxID=46969 RepID=A0A7J6V970_THATH|nr:rolling protein [Thalictrum thalictroides]